MDDCCTNGTWAIRRRGRKLMQVTLWVFVYWSQQIDSLLAIIARVTETVTENSGTEFDPQKSQIQ